MNENKRSEENDNYNPSTNNFDYENETFDEDPEETKGSSFNYEEEEVSLRIQYSERRKTN